MGLKVINYNTEKTDFIVNVDEEDSLVQSLRYDGEYNLAVCIECKYALPLEWIRKHFSDKHNVKVYESIVSLIYIVYGGSIGLARRMVGGKRCQDFGGL